jgi:hypothetical protein
MASTETLLRAIQAGCIAESTLSFFNSRVSCAQAGFFNPNKILQPNLVISPANEAPQPDGSRLLNARDDVVTVTFFAYQTEFGTEAGLFGRTGLTGIVEIGALLKAYLAANQFSAITIPRWVSTEYPNYYDRNFEQLSEIRLSFAYRLRGTVV